MTAGPCRPAGPQAAPRPRPSGDSSPSGVVPGGDPSSGRSLVAACAVTTVCVFPPFLLGAMAVQVRGELGFSEAGTGLGVGAFFGAAAALSAVLGRRAERLGARRALRVAVVWSGAVQLAVAVVARSLPTLLGLLALAGAANALAQPAANLLIARALPARRQGVGFAVKQSCVPLATLLGGLAVPAVALTVGWRVAFAASAVLAVVSAVLVPRSLGPAVRILPTADRAVPGRTMAVLSFGIALGAASCGALGAFLVTTGVEVGLRPGTAGLALTLGSVLCVVGRLTAGARADRRTGGHLRAVAVMLLCGAVGCALLATGRTGAFLAAVPLAFGLGWAWPGLFQLAIVLANPGAPAAATGFIQTGTYLGAVVGPLCFGLLAERASFSVAWLVAAGSACAASLAITGGRAMLRRDRLSVEPLPPIPV